MQIGQVRDYGVIHDDLKTLNPTTPTMQFISQSQIEDFPAIRPRRQLSVQRHPRAMWPRRKFKRRNRQRLTEINRLCEALSKVVKSESVGAWLQRPNNAFDSSTPLQVIERGEVDRLWRMFYRLESGEPG
jgi:uncharacterized protein (DUF2384 family)